MVLRPVDAERSSSWGKERAVVFLVCLAATSVLNASFFTMPPVWDAAAGVFAPAVYLYETGFDLTGLLSAPGYLEAGPNVHSLSLITLVTLAAIAGANGDPSVYLPALHILQLLFAALAATVTFELSRRQSNAWIAGGITATLLLFPLFLVQSGALYTEVAGCAAILLSVACFATRRYGWLAVCVATACLVKSFGVVAVVGFGALALLDSRTPVFDRLRHAAALVLPALIIEVTRWRFQASQSAPAPETLALHFEKVGNHLLQVPDLFVLVVLALGIAAYRTFRWQWRQLLAGDASDRAHAAALILPVAFVGFVSLVPLSGSAFPPLARYYVWVLPLLLIAPLPTLTQRSSPRLAAALTAALLLFVGLNRDGRFYPDDEGHIRHFSRAERSYEYLDYYRMQHDGVRGVAEMARGRPVFVTRGEYYYLSSPLMGWVDEPVSNVRFALQPPFESGLLADYPTNFFVLATDTNGYHGRRTVLRIIQEARRSADYAVLPIGDWEHGRYAAKLVQIRKLARPRSRRR